MKIFALLLGMISFSALASLQTNLMSFSAEPGHGGISQSQFDKVIDHIEKVYAPVMHAMTPRLVLYRDWHSPVVNAYATLSPYARIIDIKGGLARYPSMTEDGFALVVCHELGHHMGGFPAPKILSSIGALSSEGQADYFASLKCLRRIFLKDNNVKLMETAKIPKKLKENCEESFANKEDAAICMRSGLAGLSFTKFSADLRSVSPPQIETPDKRAALVTDNDYPSPQCRLDTIVQGAICTKPLQEDISSEDETGGVCHAFNGDSAGMRPACWFVPSI